jgi:hypothetical protein
MNDQREPMEDPVEVRRRIEQLVTRVQRRDAYGHLLAAGQVIAKAADVEDPQEWRASIRRHARADRIKVTTGANHSIVWALLADEFTPSREEEWRQYLEVLRIGVPRAIAERHEPVALLRDGHEALFGCQRCSAVGFADGSAGPLLGGTLFDAVCPHEGAPATTPLAFGWGSA